ncbi:putative BRCT domain-containing protein [Helianthus annuus]|nr:putative BRCT domain-containing protein [Helianthus annuus]KAJ0548339.1 putative BRCT domain-containing protein [Helianthus annuus]KAJ0554707.1 putative BRCT domain-containing protein [Helianthus annuus]KAJ0720270.1 putative BRCT domain-containing protein [Helianthus annuus]KAJ0723488.1 putative BRCT domain-containing protein [Helianthus annuus]
MVELMGAQVSKPLIATKVTHLICYKFEGGFFTEQDIKSLPCLQVMVIPTTRGIEKTTHLLAEELKVMSKEVEYCQLADVAAISSKCWEL